MEWTRGSVLGRGSSATVSTATSTSGEVFAVKSVALSQSESLQKEKHFLSIFKNSCVVGYKGCEVSRENGKMVYNLFMEFMSSGSIVDLLNRRNGVGLTDLEIRRFTRQIVEGLDYVHDSGVVHCDIKGGNVLIDESGAKIGDFGCAKWVCDDEFGTTIRGTPLFMAPEVARGEEQGFPADVWAVGCTVIEMATGGLPWSNLNDPVSVLYKIGFSGEIPGIPDGFSGELKDFVGKCLVRDPKQRWTAKQLLKHPFVIGEFDDQNPKEIIREKMITDSPTSILDQDVWNSMEESLSLESSVGIEFCETTCSWNSLRQRIKQLSDKSEIPKWGCEKGESDWMTIRMNEDGDGKSSGGAVEGGRCGRWRWIAAP
ncbi:hypothetical protein L6452_00786 [Arctium lappa]|uniref:Uncharacterized protein n=1 Tax=Arctium lappa TaxID=4217 RepID=A0ACB9FG51_ARCLA|nr:hypothetical protein L6452_00786 [Arctium lappa]